MTVMKRKFKKTLYLSGVLMCSSLLFSCSVKYALVTNNPVGEKVGESKASIFSSDQDFSQHRAAKNGMINKIGVVEEQKALFFNKTTVSGN